MGIEVIYASTDRDLATTGALKAIALGATATSTAQDDLFSNLIRRGSRWAESVLGYPITVQTYRETVPTYQRRNLMLGRTPVRAVKAMFDSTDTGSADQLATCEIRVEDRDAGFISRDDGWIWTAVPDGDLESRPLAGQEFRPWLTDYVAGWTYSGLTTSSANWSTENGSTDTGRTLPEDIEQAVLLWAAEQYLVPLGVNEERLGDVWVKYNKRSGADDMSEQEQLLQYYRRVV